MNWEDWQTGTARSHEWIFRGTDCCWIAVTDSDGGEKHYTGYAHLPRVVEMTTTQIREEYNVSVHGGITYGPDEKGVIGIDFAHAGDACFYSDGTPFQGYTTQSELEHREKFDKDRTHDWYPEDVQAEVERLVTQIRPSNLCDCGNSMLYNADEKEFYCPVCHSQ